MEVLYVDVECLREKKQIVMRREKSFWRETKKLSVHVEGYVCLIAK